MALILPHHPSLNHTIFLTAALITYDTTLLFFRCLLFIFSLFIFHRVKKEKLYNDVLHIQSRSLRLNIDDLEGPIARRIPPSRRHLSCVRVKLTLGPPQPRSPSIVLYFSRARRRRWTTVYVIVSFVSKFGQRKIVQVLYYLFY